MRTATITLGLLAGFSSAWLSPRYHHHRRRQDNSTNPTVDNAAVLPATLSSAVEDNISVTAPNIDGTPQATGTSSSFVLTPRPWGTDVPATLPSVTWSPSKRPIITPQPNATAPAIYGQTTLTVEIKKTRTIISCAPTVTNCPLNQASRSTLPTEEQRPVVVTEVVDYLTTVCPISDVPKISSSVLDLASSGLIVGATYTGSPPRATARPGASNVADSAVPLPTVSLKIFPGFTSTQIQLSTLTSASVVKVTVFPSSGGGKGGGVSVFESTAYQTIVETFYETFAEPASTVAVNPTVVQNSRPGATGADDVDTTVTRTSTNIGTVTITLPNGQKTVENGGNTAPTGLGSGPGSGDQCSCVPETVTVTVQALPSTVYTSAYAALTPPEAGASNPFTAGGAVRPSATEPSKNAAATPTSESSQDSEDECEEDEEDEGDESCEDEDEEEDENEDESCEPDDTAIPTGTVVASPTHINGTSTQATDTGAGLRRRD